MHPCAGPAVGPHALPRLQADTGAEKPRVDVGIDGGFQRDGFYHGLMVENHKKTIGKWWFNGGLMWFNQQNGDFNGMYPLVN